MYLWRRFGERRGGEWKGGRSGPRDRTSYMSDEATAYIACIYQNHSYTHIHTHIYRCRREYLGIVVYVISAPVAAKTRMWPHQAR